uniref:Putative secreted protein n=1 Tax=Anopheles darlingi TaxID=43151 RepID=A0A2M4DFC0_ANODA
MKKGPILHSLQLVGWLVVWSVEAEICNVENMQTRDPCSYSCLIVSPVMLNQGIKQGSERFRPLHILGFG